MADINKVHELAMLYLSNQDLSKASPEELVTKYKDVLEAITVAFRQQTPNDTQQRIRY